MRRDANPFFDFEWTEEPPYELASWDLPGRALTPDSPVRRRAGFAARAYKDLER